MSVIKRNKLVLEHVVANRQKTLADELGSDMQKKKLTSNIGNSTQKTYIDIDFMELKRFIDRRN